MEMFTHAGSRKVVHGWRLKTLVTLLCLAVSSSLTGCSDPVAVRDEGMLERVQAQVAARNQFAWVGAKHNEALEFIYADMKAGGIYHSPQAFCQALRKAMSKYYKEYQPSEVAAAAATDKKAEELCTPAKASTSGSLSVRAPTSIVATAPITSNSLVDTVTHYSSLSPNAQKLLSKIEYYYGLYGKTVDLSNALASVDASAQTMVSGGEREIVLAASSGTVSSSGYWETNMYSWAAMYQDTTTGPTGPGGQYLRAAGSLQGPLSAGFDIKYHPGPLASGWGDCWGYLNSDACTAAKVIIGADIAGIVTGAVSAWYTGPTGIAAAGLAEGAGTSALAAGGAVLHHLIRLTQ